MEMLVFLPSSMHTYYLVNLPIWLAFRWIESIRTACLCKTPMNPVVPLQLWATCFRLVAFALCPKNANAQLFVLEWSEAPLMTLNRFLSPTYTRFRSGIKKRLRLKLTICPKIQYRTALYFLVQSKSRLRFAVRKWVLQRTKRLTDRPLLPTVNCIATCLNSSLKLLD